MTDAAKKYEDTAAYRYSQARYDLSDEELYEAYPTRDTVDNDSQHPGVVVEDWAHVIEKATGEDTGFLRRVKGRSLINILKQLRDHLDREGLDVDEYFTVRCGAEVEEWPDAVSMVQVYAVEGGSEGHYVHIDVVAMEDRYNVKTHSLFLLKTFRGMRHALRLSNALTEAFYR